MVSKLTNPFAGDYPDLRPLLAELSTDMVDFTETRYFFPPSRAHETDLVEKLYGKAPIPDDFSLVDEMLSRLRSGPERRQTKVWAFLGWSSRPATIFFAQEPKASVFNSRSKRADRKVELHFSAIRRKLPYPVMAEVYVERILDRAGFRAHCDQYKTRSAILNNL